MAKHVKMQATAASPQRILDAGRVYRLSDSEAAELVKGGFARYEDAPKKVDRIPPQPDPEDVTPELEDDDGDEEEDD